MTCACGRPAEHDESCPIEREDRAIAWALNPFTWTVTFPDLPIPEFDRISTWLGEQHLHASWGKWTVHVDNRVSAAAAHGIEFHRLADLVALVEDWHVWCGATVRVPPLPYGSKRFRKLAAYVAEYDPGAEAVQATVAFALNPDDDHANNSTTLLFIDGHVVSELVALLDPAIDAGVVPF